MRGLEKAAYESTLRRRRRLLEPSSCLSTIKLLGLQMIVIDKIHERFGLKHRNVDILRGFRITHT